MRVAVRLFPCVVLMGAMGVPSTAFAEDPAVPRHVQQLVDEVLLVVDEVKRQGDRGSEAEKETASNRDKGVVPFTRTVVALLWRGLPVAEDRADGEEPETPVFIQVKPKSGGGQFRCKIRF